jgi:hypothetical protein
MNTETPTRFNFGNCFYRGSRNTDQEICNVTVACAIMLVLFGSFQDSNINREDLINTVIGIASGTATPSEKTTAVRGALGNSMKCNPGEVKEAEAAETAEAAEVSETKLVTGVHGTRVDEVTRLYHCKRGGGIEKYDLISFLLAYFNLPNTLTDVSRSIAMSRACNNNRLLYTVLNAISNKFQTKGAIKLYDGGNCWSLPFMGTGIISVGTTINLSITLAKELKHEEMQIIASCLSDIQTAVDQADGLSMQTDMPLSTDKPQHPPTIMPQSDMQLFVKTSDDRCNSVKENLKERPYIALFAIAAAALLTGGAIALTTYFHVGTTLMLASGFIPFLNFVGGFQISLLLGIVTAATACAGVCVAVKERSKCCKLKCLKDSSEYDSQQEPKRSTLFDKRNFTH